MTLRFWISALRDEEAQASTEYILMMSMAVAMCVMVVKKLIVPVMSRLSTNFMSTLSNTLFNEQTMHHIRVPTH